MNTTRLARLTSLWIAFVLSAILIAPLAHASPDAGPSTGPPAAEAAVAGQPEGPPVQFSVGQGNDTTPDVVPDDWWSRVQEDIRRSEYHVTWQDFTYLDGVPAAYQA